MVKNVEKRFLPVKVLSRRLYGLKQRRNLAATLIVFMSAVGYAVLVAMTRSQRPNVIKVSLSPYLGIAVVYAMDFLIISGLFRLSVAADLSLYGQLKALGMTSRQIRRLIYGQANRLCVIGLLLGLIGNCMLGIRTPFILAASAVLVWATVWTACLYPAYLAGRVSPGEALCQNSLSDKRERRLFAGVPSGCGICRK